MGLLLQSLNTWEFILEELSMALVNDIGFDSIKHSWQYHCISSLGVNTALWPSGHIVNLDECRSVVKLPKTLKILLEYLLCFIIYILCTTTTGLIGSRSNGNEGVFHILERSRNWASPSGGLVTYPEYSLGIVFSVFYRPNPQVEFGTVFKGEQFYLPYLPTPPPEQDMTQGQFLSGV